MDYENKRGIPLGPTVILFETTIYNQAKKHGNDWKPLSQDMNNQLTILYIEENEVMILFDVVSLHVSTFGFGKTDFTINSRETQIGPTTFAEKYRRMGRAMPSSLLLVRRPIP